MGKEYYPTKRDFIATGIVGCLVYILVGCLAAHALKKGTKNAKTKLFFVLITVMSCLELPRFFAMAIFGDYSSRSFYVLHIFSGSVFFGAFSVVCLQWRGLVKLSSYFNHIYSAKGLLAANIIFGAVDIVDMILCGTSASLKGYFKSVSFEVFTFLEGVRNIFYSGLLAYYGLRLICRFYRYRNIERQYNGASQSVFSIALFRFTVVLVLSTACFALRIIMLILKMAALHSDSTVTSQDFPLFGFMWFCLSDFIPRAVPSILFIMLMQTKQNYKSSQYGVLKSFIANASIKQDLVSHESGGEEEGYIQQDDDFYSEISEDEDDFTVSFNTLRHSFSEGTARPNRDIFTTFESLHIQANPNIST